MRDRDTYVYEKTIKFPNMVVNVFRPVLTEEERKRRMEAIKKATAALMLEVEKNKTKG